jgi:hypothetical protein
LRALQQNSEEAHMSHPTTIGLGAMALLCSEVALPSAATAQTANDLIGTWTMVSNVIIHADGSRVDALGPTPKGLNIFASNGHFVWVANRPDLPKFASSNRATGTPEENKAVVLGSVAMFGTWSVADKVLTYKYEGGTYPNWYGTDQRQTIDSFTGDELKVTAPASIGDTVELTFKRLK